MCVCVFVVCVWCVCVHVCIKARRRIFFYSPFYPSKAYSLACFSHVGLSAFSLVFCFGNPPWKRGADGTHVVSFFWFPCPCEDYPATLSRRRWRPYGELYPRRSFPFSSSHVVLLDAVRLYTPFIVDIRS